MCYCAFLVLVRTTQAISLLAASAKKKVHSTWEVSTSSVLLHHQNLTLQKEYVFTFSVFGKYFKIPLKRH